jgi:hypothetical protein
MLKAEPKTKKVEGEARQKSDAPCMIIFCAFDQQMYLIELAKRYGLNNYINLVFRKNFSAQVLKANMKVVGNCEYGLILYRDKLPKFRNKGKMIFKCIDWPRDGESEKIHPTQKPVELLPEVANVLQQLNGTHKLIVATKGDLKDQHLKLHDSGIGHYFHHIEVMSDKTEIDYQKMLGRLDIQPDNFVMIGNSLKSDVLPVLKLEGHAIHIPYQTTWAYERIDYTIEHRNFKTLNNIGEVLPILMERAI